MNFGFGGEAFRLQMDRERQQQNAEAANINAHADIIFARAAHPLAIGEDDMNYLQANWHRLYPHNAVRRNNAVWERNELERQLAPGFDQRAEEHAA